jgi:ABC-2 type transport system permease protein
MWQDELRCIYQIAQKDMRTYYLKPPAISWGIVFPVAWTLAFYLRNPQDFEELVPGLIAMTMLFSTTAAEAVVINFELRIGSLDRLLLAPVSAESVLLAKVLGGFAFGALMTLVVIAGCTISLDLHINYLSLFLISTLSLLVFSSMGAFASVSVKEVFDAQTLLNLPRFLMIFLCGVVYPVSAMPAALQMIAKFLPLTYTVNGLKSAFDGSYSAQWWDYFVLLAFLMIFLLPAMRQLGKKFE